MAAAVGGGGTRRAWWMAARQLLWQLLEEEEIVSRFVCVERATCEPLTSCTVRERPLAEKASVIKHLRNDALGLTQAADYRRSLARALPDSTAILLPDKDTPFGHPG